MDVFDPGSGQVDISRLVNAGTAMAARGAELAIQVRAVFAEFNDAYRCLRDAKVLSKRGHPCSVALVADVTPEPGLLAAQPRANRATTTHGEGSDNPDDLLNRDFTADDPGTRLVGDITCLRTTEGWPYLAIVMNLATRMAVGWQITDHMRTSLVSDALEMARLHRHRQPGAIVHPD